MSKRKATKTTRRQPQAAVPRGQAAAAALLEAWDDLYDRMIDPREALYDDGEFWVPIGVGNTRSACEAIFRTEPELTDIREKSRQVCAANPFALCGIENRVSYLVGSGHSYTAEKKRPDAVDSSAEAAVAAVQFVVDAFVNANRWQVRQQEAQRRRDRDGEVFLRKFPNKDGILRVRFIEPGQVATPNERAGKASETFGVIADSDDVETVLGYWVDGEEVSAEKIQHRKANVDLNVKRGLPLFHPVRKNLMRAEKLLRNMSVVAEIQAAIAIIRKHGAGTAGTIQAFRDGLADKTLTNTATGATRRFQAYRPGTVLDVSANTDYEFPAAGIDAGRYVTVLQAELRAIAARLVMPEFMLTSDASNANYASTMVAEGPAVKMFERLQWETIEDDLALIQEAVDFAAESGLVPKNWRAVVKLTANPPNVTSRDPVAEATANATLVTARIRSRRTAAEKVGDDPQVEAQRLADERAEDDPFAALAGDPSINQYQADAVTAPETTPAETVNVAATALNGAQIDSLLGITASVSTGQLPKPAAKLILAAAFPTMDAAQVAGIVDSLEVRPVAVAEPPAL